MIQTSRRLDSFLYEPLSCKSNLAGRLLLFSKSNLYRVQMIKWHGTRIRKMPTLYISVVGTGQPSPTLLAKQRQNKDKWRWLRYFGVVGTGQPSTTLLDNIDKASKSKHDHAILVSFMCRKCRERPLWSCGEKHLWRHYGPLRLQHCPVQGSGMRWSFCKTLFYQCFLVRTVVT